MSFPATIDLPSPLGEGTHYTMKLLSSYLRAQTPAGIREDVASHGYYLAKGENANHESIALEKFKLKLNDVLSGEVEARKNSWANSLNCNLNIGDDKEIASMLASIWRRYLTETSLRKAELSVLGYTLNGNQRCKTKRVKETQALCEYCHQEITVPVGKGFTCPHCNTFFHDFEPQKARIELSQKEWSYEERLDEDLSIVERIRKNHWGVEKTNLKSAAQLTMM